VKAVGSGGKRACEGVRESRGCLVGLLGDHKLGACANKQVEAAGGRGGYGVLGWVLDGAGWRKVAVTLQLRRINAERKKQG